MRNFSCLLLFILLTHSLIECQEQRYDFLNPSVPLEKRVDDLISRMTLEEKVGQLMFQAPAIQ